MKKAPLFWSVTGLLILLLIAQLVLPGRDMSEMENRMLNQAPAFTMEGFISGDWVDKLDQFTADQLPLRDAFVSLHAAWQHLLGMRAGDNVIQGGDWLFERSDGWSQRCVTLNTKALAKLSQLTGRQVYLLAVPSSACLYPEKVPAYAPMTDETALLDTAAEQIPVLPLLPAMQAVREEHPLYYRTDHHWSGWGVQVGYETACRALHLTPLPAVEAQSYPGFYGSYYARHPLPGLPSDTLFFSFPDDVHLSVNGEEKDGLWDVSALAKRDKYAALLYGNHAVIELNCDSAPEGTLIVIKDSYANALLPLLARHYRRVVAVDARDFTGNIVEFVQQYEGDTVLCVYGLYTLATGYSIYRLEGL